MSTALRQNERFASPPASSRMVFQKISAEMERALSLYLQVNLNMYSDETQTWVAIHEETAGILKFSWPH